MDILWLTGAPGAGKSTLAWAAYETLRARGDRVAHVDIDQLGMLYPETPADPTREALKHAALARYAATLHGVADRLLVSGVADGNRPGDVPGARVRTVLLTAAPEVLRERLAARGWPAEAVAEALAAAAERPEGVVSLDGTGRAVDDLVGDLVAGWDAAGPSPAGPSHGADPLPADPPAAGEVLWLTGPRCVGTSTAGWTAVLGGWLAGRPAAYLDLGQLGFVAADGGVAPAVGRAAALWRTFAARGARRLVVVGPLPEGGSPAAPFAPATVTVVRLDASAAALRERAQRRRHGGPAELAGDDLLGRSAAHAAAVAAKAVRAAALPVPDGVHRVATDDLAPEAVAEAARGRAGW